MSWLIHGFQRLLHLDPQHPRAQDQRAQRAIAVSDAALRALPPAALMPALAAPLARPVVVAPLPIIALRVPVAARVASLSAPRQEAIPAAAPLSPGEPSRVLVSAGPSAAPAPLSDQSLKQRVDAKAANRARFSPEEWRQPEIRGFLQDPTRVLDYLRNFPSWFSLDFLLPPEGIREKNLFENRDFIKALAAIQNPDILKTALRFLLQIDSLGLKAHDLLEQIPEQSFQANHTLAADVRQILEEKDPHKDFLKTRWEFYIPNLFHIYPDFQVTLEQFNETVHRSLSVSLQQLATTMHTHPPDSPLRKLAESQLFPEYSAKAQELARKLVPVLPLAKQHCEEILETYWFVLPAGAIHTIYPKISRKMIDNALNTPICRGSLQTWVRSLQENGYVINEALFEETDPTHPEPSDPSHYFAKRMMAMLQGQ